MVKKIPQILLKYYLQRNNPLYRLQQFNFLSRFYWLQPILEEIKPEIFPPPADEQISSDEAAQLQAAAKLHLGESLYLQYRCQGRNPLSCTFPQQAAQQQPASKYCQECGFPATLPKQSEILGTRGRYRIDSFLGRRGMGRLYGGTQVPDSQPIVIKEYLLPNLCFNQEEALQRKQAFVQLAGVNLADGRVQDFRLISPWEAIADANQERCYLITKGNFNTYPTLRDYLAAYGSMASGQVRQVLNQVLQTLESLHGQKYSLPSGLVQQGLAHGNLSLDSLLIESDDQQKFFIYLCDMALWERLFNLPTAKSLKPSTAQDLKALGYVSFYLLAADTGTENPKHVESFILNPSQEPPNPKDERQWPPVRPALKAFILRLLELDVPFASAQEARQALLQLPPEPPRNELWDKQPEPDEPDPKLRRPPLLLLILLATLGLALLGILIWSLLPKQQASDVVQDDSLICCIKEVAGVPGGKFTYTSAEDGTWNYIRSFVKFKGNGITIEDKLKERQPKLQLNYQPESLPEDVIAKIQTEQVDFGITNLLSELTPDMKYKEVAYDGLVVFVNFSYANRERSLPRALRGQITFEQLRQLYTGKITNWKDLNGPDMPVKLYIPTENEAVRIFEQRVLKNKQDITLFKRLIKKDVQPGTFVNNYSKIEITPLSTFDTLRQVIQDFENDKVGAISFGTVSKVFGQCSVYPLALIDGDKAPVQAIVKDNGKPVDPETDLCGDKGSYRPDIQVFKTKSYPLAYAITVISPRDNRRPPIGEKFADILRTREGQSLLSKAGLVPLQR